MSRTPDGGTPAGQEQAQPNDSNQAQETSVNWEERYKNLQSDYTKKSQELTEMKKSASGGETIDADEKQLRDRLTQQGFVKKEDVMSQMEQQKYETGFSKLLDVYPDLGKYESAIRTLQGVEGGSFEEIAIKHGFTTKDSLEKAKASRSKMVGNRGYQQKEVKPISEYTPEEWAAYKSKKGIGKGAGLVNATKYI